MEKIIVFTLLLINIAAFLYSFLKNKKNLERLTAILNIPIFGMFVILCLNKYQPDSNHLIKLTAFAVILFTIALIFIFFREKKHFLQIGYVFLILSLLPWVILYKSTFNIFRVNTVALFISILCYAALFFGLIVLIGKRKIQVYIILAIPFIFIDYINFCALVSLLAGKDFYALILYIGSGLMIYSVSFYMIQYLKPFKIKPSLEDIICVVSLNVSQFLIILSGLLMIR